MLILPLNLNRLSRPVYKVGATKYYGNAAKQYNKMPFVKHVNPDIADYATQKAIDGLFIQIAKEELNIRKNANARLTPLMQKAFSFAQDIKSAKAGK
jgi:hypothetical protein